jgi:hypothetical protein
MTLLCLGWRPGFASAAAACDTDIHFVVDRPKSELAPWPHTVVADLGDPSEVLRAVLAHGPRRLAGAVTGHEQAMASMALIRREFDLPAQLDLRTVSRFRDKFLQKSALPADIPRARCEYLPRGEVRLAALRERLGARIVVKPADGSGSRGATVVDSQQALEAALHAGGRGSDVGLVAESFVEGREIHVDGIWHRGALRWATTSAYLAPLITWSEGHAIGDAPLDADAPLNHCAVDFAVRVMAALDAPDCVFHLEAFHDDANVLHLGEVAARVAGAQVPDVLALSFGVDLFRAAIDLALGRTPDVSHARPASEGPAGFLFLVQIPGRPLALADFRARFGDALSLTFPEPGSGPGAEAGYGRWGSAILRGRDHAHLAQRLREMASFNRGGPSPW